MQAHGNAHDTEKETNAKWLRASARECTQPYTEKKCWDHVQAHGNAHDTEKETNAEGLRSYKTEAVTLQKRVYYNNSAMVHFFVFYFICFFEGFIILRSSGTTTLQKRVWYNNGAIVHFFVF